ncbi:unnamed protein product [Bursaphelenchus okinawaensis]|uniref:MPN domain-containing protein n=1 Tax=Bursaphelenchus okinawaensis TaxID=465554 RepID=A0A811JWJ4_9BILA|nr:unnamed protein product [Bursaphelenchus okinawaensis]CAG9086820.1 unnamed protein product [Bursaphelenchus okinawaensis]
MSQFDDPTEPRNPDQPNGEELVVATEQVIDTNEDELPDQTNQIVASEDIYEFKESPEGAIDSLARTTDQVDTVPVMETEDEEIDTAINDTINNIEPDLNVYDNILQVGNMAANTDLQLDDNEELSRRVPPLRIQLPKGEDDDFEEEDNTKETKVTPKKQIRTPRKGGVDKKGAHGRITRSSTRQTTKKEQKSPGEQAEKRARSARRSTTRETPARNLEVDNNVLTLGLSTPQISIPNSPDVMDENPLIRPVSNEPSLSLQPDRMSDRVYALFDRSDISRRSGIKKMLIQKWKTDFTRQQQPIKLAEFVDKINEIEEKLPYETTCQYLIQNLLPTDKTSMESLIESHEQQCQVLTNRQRAQRQRLMEQAVRQTFKELNYVRQRSSCAINAIRLLNDSEMLNANQLDERNDDALKQIGAKPRAEIVKELRERFSTSVFKLYNSQKMESDCLFVKQKDEWRRFVLDQMPLDVINSVEDPVIKELNKDIKRMVKVNTVAYCKISLHAVKYPHCAVRGLLIGRVKENEVVVVDVVPVLHGAFMAAPVEACLIHTSAYCDAEKLKIVGCYVANERVNDNSLDYFWAKLIYDKLHANGILQPVAIRVDNTKLSSNSNTSCLVSYVYDTAKWKQVNTTLSNTEEALSTYSAALQTKLHRNVIDFEGHLDDPSNDDFFNTDVAKKLVELSS